MGFDRKKRRISVGKSKLPPKVKAEYEEPLDDGSADEQDEGLKESRFKIVSGLRRRKRRIRLISYGIILLLIVALIVADLLTPTGLLESIQNGYSCIGKGKLPVRFYSADCSDFVTGSDVSTLINDTYLEVYNNKGKLVQAVSHGLSNPRLETSEARFLLFDRDRYSVKVYNYSSELYARDFEHTVVSADISRSGVFAVVTGSDTHFAALNVYDKDNELLFSWSSADYYITDVAVSDSGKSVAVSLLNASEGSFVSSVYILEYDSITPKIRFDFEGALTSLRSVNKDHMVVSGVDSAYILPWGGSEYTDLGVTGVIRNISDPQSGHIAICYGRENNEMVNSVVVIDPEGKVGQPFQFNSKIVDVSVTKTGVALLSDNSVYIYNHGGGAVAELETEIKPKFIGLLNNGSVLVCDNSQMNKLSVSKE